MKEQNLKKGFKFMSDKEVKKMLKEARHKCAFCGGEDTAFCCMECKENAKVRGFQEAQKNSISFEELDSFVNQTIIKFKEAINKGYLFVECFEGEPQNILCNMADELKQNHSEKKDDNS